MINKEIKRTKETKDREEIKRIITKNWALMQEMHEPVNENLYMPEIIQARVNKKIYGKFKKEEGLKNNLIIERTKNDRTRKTGTRIQGIRRLSQQWDVRTRP